MKRRTVVSMEQALSLTYATLRFVQLGWRVIRLEPTPYGGGRLAGDPNRYIGDPIEGAGEDRHSYFIAPNVGKEALALNLKEAEGRAALHRIIKALDVDVFCCNTLPGRYSAFGIDYETLKSVKSDIIWAGISAMGPAYPDRAGYDPAIQAMVGYMELTGFPDGPPTLAGIPLIDLKAGDEVYANVCLGLAERAETGEGRRIDVSMAQAAASWLITTLPLLDFGAGPEEVTRWGNAHRKFIPTNVYPASDGYVYIAIGNDLQWERLCAIPRFAALAGGSRTTMRGRYAEREAIYAEIGAASARAPRALLAQELEAARLPYSLINDVAETKALANIRAKLTRTTTPAGAVIEMQPMAVDLPGEAPQDFAFAPKYAEHTDAVLAEAGYGADDIAALKSAGAIV